ncbi:MAG TPA: YdbL family protein [Steroidobacteraceae bacterium]|nr:YdbL family protein [Steroidobacteraceae bacterium]
MRRVLPLKVALVSLLIAACVTINVYFPAAAADKAADQFINEVTKGGSGGGSNPPPQSYLVPSKPNATRDVFVAALDNVMHVLVPAAQAQDAEAALNVSSPAVSRIKQSMAGRFGDLEKFFASGAVGLTKDGMIDVRDINAVALPDRATVKRLVTDDNADRTQLYAEIAKASNHPEWEKDIRDAFARRWVATGAKPGWYYQDASGAWKQK